nr:hypothetical protein [uncultured Psychroserpens sp.]
MGFKTTIHKLLQGLYTIFKGLLIIVAVLLIIIVVVNIGFNLTISNELLVVFTGIAIAIIFYFLNGKKKLSKSKKTVGFLLFEILKLGFFTYLFFVFVFSLGPVDLPKRKPVVKDETVKLVIDSSSVRINKFYLSQQTWVGFKREKHTMPFKVEYDGVINSKKNRNDFKVTYGFKWGDFYKTLSDNDRPLIEELAQTFYSYQEKKKMSRRDFAELMITAIQDIPYTLILGKVCDSLITKPCYGNIKLGLFAPAEFVSNLTGDCDTRTVLLFTLLSRFNYDIAILNSKAYRHSVLGINIPSTGKFKMHQNTKYYFIETTARGCPIGYLNQSVSDISKWDFQLIHNIKEK